MLVTDDGTAHLVWSEDESQVAHAIVTEDGRSKVFRQTFHERTLGAEHVSERDYVLAAGVGGELALVYAADLYEGHPDRFVPHERTWQGDRWSAARTIPFPTRMFEYPLAIRYADYTFVSWNYVPPGDANRSVRGYAIRNKHGVWTSPQPMCLDHDGRMLTSAFIGLHVDSRGRVYTAWQSGGDKEETFVAEVTELREP